MIITIRCIKKYGKRRAGFAPAVLIAVGGNSGCSMHLLIRTRNTYHYSVAAGRNLRPLDSSLMSLSIYSSTVTLLYTLLHLA